MALVSVDKGKHGFDGQKCAHTSSKSLTIQQVFSAAFSSSGHISAPSKLLRTWQGWIFEWFLFFETQMCRSPIIQIKAQRSGFDLRRKKEIAECSFCREAEAERCKLLLTRRKDALSGVSALVNRYYKYVKYYSIYIRDCKYSIFTNIYLKSRPESCWIALKFPARPRCGTLTENSGFGNLEMRKLRNRPLLSGGIFTWPLKRQRWQHAHM